MEKSLKSIVDQSKSILILLSTRPTLDQVAAGLAFYLALIPDKEVNIVSPIQMTVDYNRLTAVNKISQEIGNKNLVVRFKNYEATGIERVSYDIEAGQFRLTVIPKPGVVAPTKDQINLSYSGMASDTVILIGGVNESHFPALNSKDMANVNLVHIGTRALNLGQAKQAISLASPASSVSELGAKLLKENEMLIDSDIATNLLIGIESGSSKFSSPDSTAETFQIVAELMQAGGRRVAPRPIQPGQFPPGAIPGQLPQAQQQVLEKIAQAQARMQPQPTQPSQLQPENSAQQPTSQIQQPKVSEKRLQGQKEGTAEIENPPKDWLKPKIIKGTSTN